jgi:ABC-type transport system involved in cytochrome bd biosynthesis fused ATPase/permease subunit
VYPAISTTGLVKEFGSTRALDRLDLTVRRGEVHGFLGPNGAGKTITIRVLFGLLRRDAGAVTVSILVGRLFGAATLQLPQWLQDISPLTHIPKAPAGDITALPVIAMIAFSALLTAAGLALFRRRDLALPA